MQLIERLLSLRVTGMLFEQIEQHGAGLIAIAFQAVNARQIQVRLIEAGRDADAFFELRHGIVPPAGSQIQDAEVVQRLRISGAQFQSILQILIGAVGVVRLRIDHRQAVIRFRVLRPGSDRSLQGRARVVPAFLLPIRVPQIFQRDPIIGAQAESFLKISDGFVGAPLARGEKSEIVPRVWYGVGITRSELQGLLEAGARFARSFLLQVDAAQAVLSLCAGWIVAQRKLERRCGLIVIAALKECRAERQMVAAELISFGVAGEGKRQGQALCGGLRDAPEIFLDIRADRLGPGRP